MAAGSAARVIRAPGRIVVGPTNLASEFPYGGTEIGKTNACVMQPFGTGFRVVSEGLGEATDVLEASNEFVVSFFVRGWDDEAVELLLSDGQAVGSNSRHRVWSSPGNVTPGASALPRALKVLFVPDDTVHVPAMIVYRGVPQWVEGAQMAFQRGEELGLPVALDCVRDTANRILAVGMLADLSL